MSNIVYKVVFDKIMEQLDNGVAPWKKPWTGSFPYNGKSKHQYRGINFWLLISQDFEDPRWYTFNQVQELGGNVKKGEKSTPIVFWSIVERIDANGNKKKSAFLKYFKVFNAEQTEGLKLEKLVKDVKPTNNTAKSLLENFISREGINTKTGNKACYIPSLDTIVMPSLKHFDNEDAYWSVYSHESVHSCAHPNRLDQKPYFEKVSFGSESYSRGELVAEMGATFLCHHFGIDNTIKNSASYIEGWKSFLKSDPEALVKAASDAQKCADYILGIKEGAIDSSIE